MEVPFAEDVTVSDDTLCVDLSDGRSISVPLAWYPRLLRATAAERKRWRLIDRGLGIHWEDLDEDISVEGDCWLASPLEKAKRPSASGLRSGYRA